ncbi:metallophosphoesterase family protein [Halorientalis brevis]|uniref:Phosphoesterase n=1 Tax=Halorientalis brevis TaxID=1126241 RepID=A0ABD6CGE5_9EURY|nr:metallophosphoesterase family protein [Halorientalis brevis]
MKIGAISDIHSNWVALNQVLNQPNINKVSDTYCAGDLVGYYAQPNEVIARIRKEKICSVKGNHDAAVVNSTPSSFSIHAKRAIDWNRRNLFNDNMDYLSSLPTQIRKFVNDRDLLIVHGSPKNPLSEYIYERDIDELFLEFYFDLPPDVIVLGHTHRPFVKKVNNTLIVNPGSVGQPRDKDPRASYATINLNELSAKIHRVEYDINKIAEKTAKELPRALSDRLYEGR